MGSGDQGGATGVQIARRNTLHTGWRTRSDRCIGHCLCVPSWREADLRCAGSVSRDDVVGEGNITGIAC